VSVRVRIGDDNASRAISATAIETRATVVQKTGSSPPVTRVAVAGAALRRTEIVGIILERYARFEIGQAQLIIIAREH